MLRSIVATSWDARKSVRVDVLFLVVTTCLISHMTEASSHGYLLSNGAQDIESSEVQQSTYSPHRNKLPESHSGERTEVVVSFENPLRLNTAPVIKDDSPSDPTPDPTHGDPCTYCY